ncbi:uncharacterized protein [Euwallacea fornicatus]|uniref:uncharacterized protein n=1 Tax=Euwallacea fornicatus TaxID=995702 RepID=UPI00338EC367
MSLEEHYSSHDRLHSSEEHGLDSRSSSDTSALHFPEGNLSSSHLLPLPGYNLSIGFELYCKKTGYVMLVVLSMLIGIAYVYSHPETGVRLTWKRSMKKMKRLSKTILPSLRISNRGGLYPYIECKINMTHLIIKLFFE